MEKEEGFWLEKEEWIKVGLMIGNGEALEVGEGVRKGGRVMGAKRSEG